VQVGERLRVLIADDHPLYRDGIVRAVRERHELEIVAECADGRAALEAIRDRVPDVAVIDLFLPALGGIEILNAVRRDRLSTRVLVLSASTDGSQVHAAMAAGAAGYVAKSADRVALCDAIAAVARGQAVLDQELQAGLLEQVRAHGQPVERPALTKRETQVLRLLAEGHSAPAIGRRLYLAPATVKTHLGHLYEKLDVSDRAACVAQAMRAGLIE
jgi:two-component system nitrate/nitrite response regulator NarL